jgi:hypothetical protein
MRFKRFWTFNYDHPGPEIHGFQTQPCLKRGFSFSKEKTEMKMGKNDPRSSMSKSVKGKPSLNKGGKNPFKSASPYETPGVGEGNPPKGPSLKQAPDADPVADEQDSGDSEN